ncbi:hypothetical protein M5362_06245 [Streptomyces sp. Je 1-79]|uniref:hypothetical protein n=1 Tax=Streptomyces sp. Je 1-79 TaxID=2943847 RepID=UPI0021A5E86C|nr:hypothetical protein [Streptomyces sp. Je 1-79]MCT4352729.1 hypothetical protein [Streptomyces sp. Je 1-79]
MEAAIVIMALLFFAFVALGVYATVKAVKAAKRGVDRTINQARRTVEDTTLRAKSYGQGGVGGELAQLRLSLRTSMRATQDALQAGVTEDASLKESLDLFQRLTAHGRELDEDLKRLEREPDRARVAAQLTDLRERTERITHSADSLRWAARDRAQRFAEDDLTSLSAQIDLEAGALRHWSGATAQGTASDDFSWPDASAAAPDAGRGQVWPGEADAQGADANGASNAGQRPDTAAPGQQPPQAITAPDPRRTAYPWEKTARPETTN